MAALKSLRRFTCDKGSELVEFAIVTPMLLLLVFGIADFGLMFQRYEVLTNAAREGARVAALPDYVSTDVSARVTQYLSGTGISATTTYVTPYAVTVGGACITLTGATVTYSHSWVALGGIIKLFGGSNFTTKTLTATALMRYEGAAKTC